MHILNVEYLLKISLISDAHMPISGPLFSTSTQLQAQVLRLEESRISHEY
jgi:hypothetical protein